MAKTCQIARQKRRVKKVELHRAKRTELKKLIVNAATSPEDRFTAVRQLDEMPRDGSRTRLSSRCAITGRPRAYMRTFGLCRIKFREMAGAGYLPGVTMASW